MHKYLLSYFIIIIIIITQSLELYNSHCCIQWLTSGHVIYQTQEAVFHRDIQTSRRELKINKYKQQSIFDKI